MALLDGILGGAQTAMAFGQQQTQNKLARDRYDLDVSRLGEQKRQYDQSFDETKRQYDQTFNESVRQFNAGEVYKQYELDSLKKKDAVAATRAANNDLFRTYANAGYLSTDMQNLNYNQINDDIAAGRNSDRFATAEQLVLGMATQFGDLPEGSKATAVESHPDGGYAITVTNADGSKGVVTTDGSSEPTSTVVRFAPGQLGRLANLQYRTKIATNTDEFDPVSMSTSKNLIAVDQEGQNAKAAFVEQQTQINNLLTQVKATGNVELYRAVQSAIADGGEETAALIAKDFGLPSPQAPTAPAPTSADATPTQTPTAPAPTSADATPTQAPAQTDTQAPTATTPWSMDSVDRTTKSGQLIATIEGSVKNPNRRWSNKGPSQTEKLMARKAELQKNIEQPRVNPNPRSAGRNTTSTKKAAELMADKAELEQINAYLDKDKPVLFTSPETDALAAQVEGKTTKQIAQGLDDGSITVDQQAINLVSQALKGQGLKTINDAAMSLNTRERAVARAAILATSKDPTTRNEMVRQMTSIFDTPYKSPNLDAKDVLDQQNKDRTYRFNNKKLGQDARIAYRGWMKEATEEAKKVVAGVNKRYFGENYDENNLDADTASTVMKSKEMSDFQIYLKNENLTPEEIKTAVVGLKSVMSTTMAALAGDQTGGAWETILDLIGRDETEDVVNPFDFDASRIIVDDPVNPSKIYYTDADGNYTDEDAGLQNLKDIAPSFYENVRAIGIANRIAKDKQTSAAAQG